MHKERLNPSITGPEESQCRADFKGSKDTKENLEQTQTEIIALVTIVKGYHQFLCEKKLECDQYLSCTTLE